MSRLDELAKGMPLGHSISSHVIHGWCSYCPGRSVPYEVEAWRVWAHDLLIAAEEGMRGGA